MGEFKAHELPKYSYRLNENYKEKNPSIMLDGVLVTRDWRSFNRAQDSLKQYLRNYTNPNGFLDEKVEDANKSVVHNTEITYKTKKILHTRDVLCTFKRPQLEHIARQWNINTANKRSDFLIGLIIEEQEKYKKYVIEKRNQGLPIEAEPDSEKNLTNN